ncbi:MAG: hypothetical protein JW864_11935 [Spirochaetes bacterium]|nr:hypothetical protein [Spirochaetota bacterium]
MNINEKMKQVPFGNSLFQIQNFIANQDTPERSYRHVLLQLDAKSKAMKECSFRRRRKEIEIKETEEKLKTAEGYTKERLEIDLEEAQYQMDAEIKLIEDAVIEIAAYEKILEKLGDFTREEFEQAERGYWEVRLLKNAQKEIATRGTVDIGTMIALEQIGIKVQRGADGQHRITGNITNKNLLTSKRENVN